MNGKSLLIDKDKFKDIILAIAGKRNFRPAMVEKDFYLTLILGNITTSLSDKLVFKGGSLLNKVYLDYHRLSEDLDFSVMGIEDLNSRSLRSKAMKPIRSRMVHFVKQIELICDNPKGEGFKNSTHYIFTLHYPSIITARLENIKIEIGLRHPLADKPVHAIIKHFFQDPFTGNDLIVPQKILCMSLSEAVAEKLRAALTRRDVAIRDYYDLWYIAESKFDFSNKRFLRILKKKLADENFTGDYRINFGLPPDQIALLHRQVKTDLMPVIRVGDMFDLDTTFERFNAIFTRIN